MLSGLSGDNCALEMRLALSAAGVKSGRARGFVFCSPA